MRKEGCQGLDVKIGGRPPSALEGRRRGKSKGLGWWGWRIEEEGASLPGSLQDCWSSPVYMMVTDMVLCFLESRDSAML